MKYAKAVGATGLLIGLCFSSQAVILNPGTSGLDPTQAPALTAPLDTLVTPFHLSGLSGTVTSWVVKDPANPLGGLSFYYQISNNGLENVSRFSAADFGVTPGAQVEVSTITAAFDGSVPGGTAPIIADRSSGAGSVVGFDFIGSGQIIPGHSSVILVVNTPYQTFNMSTGSVIDDNSVNVNILAPSGGIIPSIPEPSTIMAGSLLLIPFGASLLRILRKRQA